MTWPTDRWPHDWWMWFWWTDFDVGEVRTSFEQLRRLRPCPQISRELDTELIRDFHQSRMEFSNLSKSELVELSRILSPISSTSHFDCKSPLFLSLTASAVHRASASGHWQGPTECRGEASSISRPVGQSLILNHSSNQVLHNMSVALLFCPSESDPRLEDITFIPHWVSFSGRSRLRKIGVLRSQLTNPQPTSASCIVLHLFTVVFHQPVPSGSRH